MITARRVRSNPDARSIGKEALSALRRRAPTFNSTVAGLLRDPESDEKAS